MAIIGYQEATTTYQITLPTYPHSKYYKHHLKFKLIWSLIYSKSISSKKTWIGHFENYFPHSAFQTTSSSSWNDEGTRT